MSDEFDDLLDEFEEGPTSKKKQTDKKETPPEEEELDLEFEGDEEPWEEEEPESDELEEELDLEEEPEEEFDLDIETEGESIEPKEGEDEFFIDTSQEGQYDKEFEDDYSKEPKKGKQVKILTFHGRKGKGKTAAAMSVLYAIKNKKKKALVIELDKKAKPIKELLFKNDPRIIIEDASIYMKFRPAAAYLEACDKTIQYIFFLLKKHQDRKDLGLIVIDGLEVFLRGTEGRVRFIGNRPLTGGVAWELWNVRLLDIEELLNMTVKMSSHYVAFTTKTRTRTIEDDDGNQREKEYIKWHTAIEDQTDNVFKCTTIRDAEGELHFMILAESCKVDIQTGAYIDTSRKKAYPLLLKEAPIEISELK